MCALEGRAFYYIDKITQMSPIDGPIVLVSEIYLARTSDVNISEAQPSKTSGLEGVRGLRSKSAPTLYKY